MFSKILNFILDLIWPEFCLGCGQEGVLCCATCRTKIELLPRQKQVWPDLPQTYFQACYVSTDYENPLVQKIIKHYKYHFVEKLSEPLAEILAAQAQKLTLTNEWLITNVPLHARRYRSRGFDQTALLALILAKKLNLTYQPLLRRIKNTRSQAKLKKAEREKNMQAAFAVINHEISDRPILLIDDVATTGATLNEAGRALRAAGYQNITCLVIAKNNP